MTDDLIDKLQESMNNRLEATQTINPITSQQYLKYTYMAIPEMGVLEDPIQAHLKAMEVRDPSTNEHRQGLLKNLADRLYLIDRALQYRRGESGIFKTSQWKSKGLYGNIIDYMDYNKVNKKYYLDENIIKKYNFDDKDNIMKKYKNILD